MTNDLVSDTIARINNSLERRSDFTLVEKSNIVVEILKVLNSIGYISGFEDNDTNLKVIFKSSKRKINKITRVSKPGIRIYRGYKKLVPFLNGYGTILLSTPKGIMSDKSARLAKVGGEVICKIS